MSSAAKVARTIDKMEEDMRKFLYENRGNLLGEILESRGKGFSFTLNHRGKEIFVSLDPSMNALDALYSTRVFSVLKNNGKNTVKEFIPMDKIVGRLNNLK